MGKKKANIFIYVILGILTVVVLYPLYFIVLILLKENFTSANSRLNCQRANVCRTDELYQRFRADRTDRSSRMVLFHNDRFRGTDHLFYIDDCLLCDKSKR